MSITIDLSKNDDDFEKDISKQLGDTDWYTAILLSEYIYNHKKIMEGRINVYFGFAKRRINDYYISILPSAPANENGFCIIANSFYGGEIMCDECFFTGVKAINFIKNFLLKYKRKTTQSRTDRFFPNIDFFNKELRMVKDNEDV